MFLIRSNVALSYKKNKWNPENSFKYYTIYK